MLPRQELISNKSYDSLPRVTLSISYLIIYNFQEYRSAGLVQAKNLRVAKYLIPVVIASVLLNIPKFLETSVGYDEETEEVADLFLFQSFQTFLLLELF